MNRLKSIFKAFIPFIIYYILNIIFAIIINYFKNTNNIINTIYLLFTSIITIIILILLFKKRLIKDFKDFDKNYKKYLTIGIKAWFVGFIVMVISNNIILNYFIDNASSNQQINELILFKLPLYSVIDMIILGPFVEELVFRLGFKENIKNKKLYYLFTILLFAGLHTLNGIKSPIELLFFIPYGAMAASFAYTLDKTDNIYSTITIHILHNLFTIFIIVLTKMIGV